MINLATILSSIEADVRPRIDDDIPRCSECDCPLYDGKRCRALGTRPGAICEPAVRMMSIRLVELVAGKPEI